MYKADCIFCKIIAGEIPTNKIFEDDNFISFLDIAPAHEGHCLVIPKEHFDNLLDMDDATASKILPFAKKIMLALDKTLHADGYNLLQNNGHESGQEVMHYHLHIIPRYQGRGEPTAVGALRPENYTYKISKEEMASLTEKIAAALK